MMGKSKKLLSSLLALAMVLGLFAVMPQTALAATVTPGPGANEVTVNIADADTEANLILLMNDLFYGQNNSGLNASLTSYTTITVTGSKTNTTAALTMNIPAGTTVIWKAIYENNTNGNTMISIDAASAGAFEVATGGTVTATTGTAIYTGGASSTVTVSGGTVSASGAFATISATGDVTVSGGTVTATTGTAIYAGGTSSDVKVSAGSVTAAEIAINAIGNNATVEVSGGIVEATGAAGIAITTTGASSIVTISGGTVSAGDFAATIDAAGKVTVSGSSTKVENTGAGSAIDAADNVEVSGGTVTANTGTAIYANGNVEVSGGTVSSASSDTTINASGANSTVTVNGGTVENTSATGSAIKANTTSLTVTVSSGMVKAEEGGIGCMSGNVILSGGTVVLGVIDGLTVTNGGGNQLYAVDITGLPFGTYANPVALTSGFMMDSNKPGTGYNMAWMPAAASQTYTVTAGGSSYTATSAITAAGGTLNFTLVQSPGGNPGGGGGGYSSVPAKPVPEAPKPAFPASGKVVGSRITVYKLETLKTTLFRLNKGDTFIVVGIANNGRVFRIEKDGREGFVAFKDIGITFETPIKATAMKKAPVYSKLENGKLKRIGHYTTGQELWIHGISGKYLINKQPSITYYLDAAQWKLWLPQ